MRKKLLVFIGLGFFLLLLYHPFGFAPRLIYVNVTDSLPRGIYLAIPGTKIRKGDIVAFQEESRVLETIVQNGWMKEGDDPAFLKMAATEGSVYGVNASDMMFSVDGQIIGQAHVTDGKGHALTPQLGNFTVGKGRFLPYTFADRSYDGRYTGTIDASRIYSRVIPIFLIR